MDQISVIIRTYNSSDIVKKAIDSVLNQTIEKDKYEIIVIDDGSTDETIEILRKYGNKINVFQNESSGPINAINIGIKKSNGDFFILLDDDDKLIPDALEKFLNAIVKNEVDFVYSDYYEVRKKEKKLISLENNIFNSVAGGILFRKSMVIDEGCYDENLFFPEYDLLLKLINKGYKYYHLAIPLFKYYRYEGSLTSDKEAVENGINQLYKKHGHIPDIRKY